MKHVNSEVWVSAFRRNALLEMQRQGLRPVDVWARIEPGVISRECLRGMLNGKHDGTIGGWEAVFKALGLRLSIAAKTHGVRSPELHGGAL